MLHPWLGQGLLTSSGAKWHKHRKMITPSFHFKILQDFLEVININSSKFIKKLKNVSKGELIIDFQDQAHYLTLDVICGKFAKMNSKNIKKNTWDLFDRHRHGCSYQCHG